MAIASSVFGCTVLVKRTFGCGSQGVVRGDLSVRQGIQMQKWLGVVVVVVCWLGKNPFVGCYDCVGRHVGDRAAGVVGYARAVVSLLEAECTVQRFRCPSLCGTL